MLDNSENSSTACVDFIKWIEVIVDNTFAMPEFYLQVIVEQNILVVQESWLRWFANVSRRKLCDICKGQKVIDRNVLISVLPVCRRYISVTKSDPYRRDSDIEPNGLKRKHNFQLYLRSRESLLPCTPFQLCKETTISRQLVIHKNRYYSTILQCLFRFCPSDWEEERQDI